MVKQGIKIGVIGVQGSRSEHVNLMEKTLKNTNTPGTVFIIRNKNQIKDIDGLILPGGESTTISRILNSTGMYNVVKDRIQRKNLPIMGTCAGCVLLAKKIIKNSKDVHLLEAADMEVERNAFGRQKESFEQEIPIKGFDEPFNAVFIRAPVIQKIWNNCDVLAKTNGKIVMTRQNNILALSFHPELVDDIRIHKLFLDIIQKQS